MNDLPHTATRGMRWLNRYHSWALAHLDPNDYEVARINEQRARAFIIQHHYSGSLPAEIASWGLHTRQGELVGVLSLTTPMNEAVLTRPFPALVPYQESAELGRLVLLPSVLANGESWFTMQALHQAARAGFRGIVSHADPVPRYLPNGQMCKPGHYGTIYQACSAIPAGRTRARFQYVLPDHSLLNERSTQKVAAGERNAAIAVRQLLAAGARHMRHGEDPRAWLREQRDRVATRQYHPGNYRYCFVLGSVREKRALRRDIPLARMLRVPAVDAPLPSYYPKAEDF